ncbi:MAG TPA: Crp/Fnr family transcriptional regulator [Steroidobacteraceae bacterium]|nr:Crp/Fnr family transcriptional regulator [Steroidobacteraceae bacterium]
MRALPPGDCSRVRQFLHPMEYSAGTVLCEPDARLGHAYFPIDSIISIQRVTVDGASTEVASVGNEGVFGVDLVMGDEPTGSRAVVLSRGLMYRLRSDILIEEFHRGGAMQYLMLRYMRALLALVAQGAVCNQRHSIDQQLCRWILLTLDRLGSEELAMTHELLANTLGVRREGVTEAARRLQNAGLISYRRGRIRVLDRHGLVASCCECYGTVRREYDRLLDPDAYLLHQGPLAAAGRDCARRERSERILA